MSNIKKIWIGLAVGLMMLNGVLYAADRGRGGNRSHGGYDRGRDHGHSSRVGFGFNIVIGAPRVRPVVMYPPYRHVVYRPSVIYAPPRPVVVVPSRTVVVQQEAAPDQTIVWITNDNGSRTPVTLTQQRDTGYYVGPRGEIYVVLPTDEQLRPLYGLPSNTVSQANLTLWVANDNGSKTPVTLIPSNGGFVGPSGEFYAALPNEAQLRAVYGLPSTQQQDNSTVVYVDNDGKKVPVVLTKEGSEYVGPNGEHYTAIPTKEQLESVYGK